MCDRADIPVDRAGDRDAYACDCPICGHYLISQDGKRAVAAEANKPKRYLLSGLTRRASDRGERLELVSSTIANLLDRTAGPRTPHDILDPLLLAVHDGTEEPSASVIVQFDDYPLYGLRNEGQLGNYLRLLMDMGLLSVGQPSSTRHYLCRLTLKGWDRVAELRHAGRSSSQAFCAMSFAEDLDQAWVDGIAPALSRAGWTPVRIDRVQHNGRIDDRIIAEIRKSGLLVADFTGQRAGVYFEAGFAAGLGLPVVWTVKESDLANVHFDTRQYNHIIWAEPADLERRLYDRLVATVRPPAG